MNRPPSPGALLRDALKQEKPLQVAGVINAYAARLAERAGFRALYVSGGGVAAGSLGVPGKARKREMYLESKGMS